LQQARLFCVASNNRNPSPMIAHLTPLEAPVVWIAFAVGVAVGALGMLLLRKASQPERS
jgi:hypothetical protein